MANVNRNQKVMGEKEKDILKGNVKVKQEKDIKDKETIKQAEIRIFEKSKETLPELLKQRLEVIETAIATELKEFSGLKETRIHQLISRQSLYSTNAMIGYSPKELMIVFEAYKEVIVKVNEIVLFVPSMSNFCAYAGFSTITFKNNLVSPDEEKRNAYNMINDYIIEMTLSASKMRKTDASSSIFELKSVHQMSEATQAQVITVNHIEDVGQIMNRINEIRKGSKIIDVEFNESEKK